MKTLSKNISRAGLLLVLLSFTTLAKAQTDEFITLSGTVKDNKTGERVVFASVFVSGTSVGTVTNSEGEFTLKIGKNIKAEDFEISHLGYDNKKFNILASVDKHTFFVEPHVYTLSEITVVPKVAKEVVRAALFNIKKNYSNIPNRMTGFYRESIKQQRDYLSISEAVVDIYKAGYNNFMNDQVRIYKGRKGDNVKIADTLFVKLQGGPSVSLLLDVVKNTDMGITLDSLDNYRFEFQNIVNVDGKPTWVINFTPDVVRQYPLYVGKIYVTRDNYAITRAEFGLDLSDEEKASRYYVQKKPNGLVFAPTTSNYLVNYKEEGGKYYLNYVRVDLKFKCDWKKKWFKNNYTVISELAITDRNDKNAERFAGSETFKGNMVLADKIKQFEDKNFWGDYNIIEPEESIQNAIKKITKLMKKAQ